MTEHDDKFSSHYSKIRANTQLLETHSKNHDEIRMFREQISRQVEKNEKIMRNNKATANDDMNKNKEELNIRIDEIEKNNMDWCDQHLQKHNEQKAKLNMDLQNIEDKLVKEIHKEIE